MTIVIVCVAGVSGTFLSLRLRRGGVDEPVRVTGLQGLASEPPHPGDLVLVAPQIAVSLDRVRAVAPASTVLELTPRDIALDGADALAARVRAALDHRILDRTDLEGETA